MPSPSWRSPAWRVAIPAVASAHVEILDTSPSKTAKTGLKQVTVTLSGPIRSRSLKVFGPQGKQVSKGAGGRDPHNFSALVVTLKGDLASGLYTANPVWVSADGRRQSAGFPARSRHDPSFTVRTRPLP
jgi:methionine-rich copper-binding protein CopC